MQILQILVRAVVENLTDNHGEQAGTVRSKLKELMGRVSSRHSSDAEIWRQYAMLYGDGDSSNVEDNEKVGVITNTSAMFLTCLVFTSVLGNGTQNEIATEITFLLGF